MKTRPQFGAKQAVALLAALLLITCSSGAQVKPLPLGSAMPDFKLKDLSGQDQSLASYKGKIVVLDFCSIKCPYSRGVDPNLQELANAYGPKGVVVLGIDSHKSVTPEQIKQYATDKKLDHPILKDLGNVYADAVGAARTPEFYVFDKDQKLVYHGAFDNRKVPEQKGDTCYVKDAIEDTLAGRPVKTPQVDAWGCTIKRAK